MGEVLSPQNKDLDVLSFYDRKELLPAHTDILAQLASVDEAFNLSSKPTDPLGIGAQDDSASSTVSSKWAKYKAFCMNSFQTRASDFAKSDVQVLFSRQVRDRLAELSVSSEQEKKITEMQQNEDQLRSQLRNDLQQLDVLCQQEKNWNMIELVSKTCRLLSETDLPQFYPAQFMLILDLVERFRTVVYDRIASVPGPNSKYLKERGPTKDIIALNWSMILSRTSRVIPRMLLQTAFLPCIKFHPFKKFDETVNQIIEGIVGIGHPTAGIYIVSYLVHIIYTYYPETSPRVFIKMFTNYARFLLSLKNGGFEKKVQILDYKFEKYLKTHKPALGYILSVVVSVSDFGFLKDLLSEFYDIGTPSSFILSILLDELPPKFIAKYFEVILTLVDKSDSIVPNHKLLNKVLNALTKVNSIERSTDIMNEIWTRISEYTNVDAFVYVVEPLNRFIVLFRPTSDTNKFLKNVHRYIEEKIESAPGEPLSKKLTKQIKKMIKFIISQGRNFQKVLNSVGSLMSMMDFLDEANLIKVSQIILNDVSQKPFELTDQLSIRILLEHSQILFQSLSVLSPVDVVERTTQTIEWFLYRAEFGNSVDVHLAFLRSARTSFPTSSRLLSVIARISLRLCNQVFAHKRSYEAIRTVLAFATCTIASISSVEERAALYIAEANTALTCNATTFTHHALEEFLAKPVPSLNLFKSALSLALITPSKPGVDPFILLKSIVQAASTLQWPNDEYLVILLDSIVIASHMLRSEYVLKVEGIDTNNIIYAGQQEFYDRGSKTIAQLKNIFMEALEEFKKKGLVAARTKVPAMAYRAIVAFVDCFEADKTLFNTLVQLAEFTKGSNSLKSLRDSTIAHLSHVFAANETGQRFIASYLDVD